MKGTCFYHLESDRYSSGATKAGGQGACNTPLAKLSILFRYGCILLQASRRDNLTGQGKRYGET